MSSYCPLSYSIKFVNNKVFTFSSNIFSDSLNVNNKALVNTSIGKTDIQQALLPTFLNYTSSWYKVPTDLKTTLLDILVKIFYSYKKLRLDSVGEYIYSNNEWIHSNYINAPKFIYRNQSIIDFILYNNYNNILNKGDSVDIVSNNDYFSSEDIFIKNNAYIDLLGNLRTNDDIKEDIFLPPTSKILLENSRIVKNLGEASIDEDGDLYFSYPVIITDKFYKFSIKDSRRVPHIFYLTNLKEFEILYNTILDVSFLRGVNIRELLL